MKLLFIILLLWLGLAFSCIFARERYDHYVYPTDLIERERREEIYGGNRDYHYRYKMPQNIQRSCNINQKCFDFLPPVQQPGSNPFFK